MYTQYPHFLKGMVEAIGFNSPIVSMDRVSKFTHQDSTNASERFLGLASGHVSIRTKLLTLLQTLERFLTFCACAPVCFCSDF